MIIDLFREGLSVEMIKSFGVRLLFILFLLPVHECAHGYIAMKLGDQTARLKGRLTLNPLAHIDPIGSLMMLFVGFGYAKAVPVNMNNFPPKKRKKYMAIVAFAGPLSNIIMALISMIIYCAVLTFATVYEGTFLANVCDIIWLIAQLNIGLAVFNLLPIPPLDGSRVLSVAIPDRYYYKIMQYERYIMIALLVLLATGGLDSVIGNLSYALAKILFNIAYFPFKFF